MRSALASLVCARGDITDTALVDSLANEEKLDATVHFAAESHVARAIILLGQRTLCLLEVPSYFVFTHFVRVSTDEVWCSPVTS